MTAMKMDLGAQRAMRFYILRLRCNTVSRPGVLGCMSSWWTNPGSITEPHSLFHLSTPASHQRLPHAWLSLAPKPLPLPLPLSLRDPCQHCASDQPLQQRSCKCYQSSHCLVMHHRTLPTGSVPRSSDLSISLLPLPLA
jgi:hypothetical protein